jgi:DNA repair protein RecN (Recombination protein N)
MITNLRIKNFAIIDDIEINFSEKFTVFTGETGAGKSIIIDAISLLLGKPGNEDLIKGANDFALIEGEFEIKKDTLNKDILEFMEDNTKLIVFRKIVRGKGNTIRINDRTVTLKKLKAVMSNLVNIIGQHDQLSLFNQERQLAFLDEFAIAEISGLKTEYKRQLEKFKQVEDKLSKLKTNYSEIERKKDFLQFQINDIAEHGFQPNEDDELQKIRTEVMNFEKINNILIEQQNNFSKISELASLNLKNTEKLNEIEPQDPGLLEYLNNLIVETEDKSLSISQKANQLQELSNTDINKIESRLDIIFRYTQKYKIQSINQLLDLQEGLEQDLKELLNFTENNEDLENQYKQLQESIGNISLQLSQKRKIAAERLSKEILSKMLELNFSQSKFEICVTYNPQKYNAEGLDSCEFLVSLNSGQPMRLISQVASGGELSRIMLAIRTVLQKYQPVKTLIFDEVDTGVGGLTALKIGEFLKSISQSCQVFCITHLPQIAKFAQNHFFVEKQLEKDTTKVTIKKLLPAQTAAELKRMVGGADIIEILSPR